MIRVGEISLLKDLIKTMEIRSREEKAEETEDLPQGTADAEPRRQLITSGTLNFSNSFLISGFLLIPRTW